MTKVKKSPKRGRPSRREASAKALRGVNLAEIDPAGMLRAIAADASAPAATARIAACRALLGQTPKKPAGDDEHDAVTKLALQLLNGRKK